MKEETPSGDSSSSVHEQHNNGADAGGVIENSFNGDLEFGAEHNNDDNNDGGAGEAVSGLEDTPGRFDGEKIVGNLPAELEELAAAEKREKTVVSRLRELIDDDEEGGEDAEKLAYKIVLEYRDDDEMTPEYVLDILEERFVQNEAGEVVREKDAIDEMNEGGTVSTLPSWENLIGAMRDSKLESRELRRLLADKIEEENSFVFVRDEARGFEDFRAYDASEGIYTWDGAFTVKQLLDEGTAGMASKADVDEVVQKLQARNAVLLSSVNNPDGQKVPVGNGVLDLKTLEIEKYTPEHMFTRKLAANWNPDVDTSEVRDFVRDITDTEPNALFLEEMLADSLNPQGNPREWFGILHGDGANGKTVIMNCLRAVIGEKHVSHETLHDLSDTRWSTAQLTGGYGKFANIAADIEGKKITSDYLLKALTGDDAVSGEHKGEQKFAEVYKGIMLFGANSPPVFAGEGENLERRLKHLYLPNTYKFVEDMTDVEKADPLVKPRDTEIQDRLTTEENLSAWLLVMVEAFERLESEGWSHEETQKELWESYQGEADTIWSFLDECVECSYGARFSDDTPIHLTVDDLHQMAASYHRANGKTLEMSAAQFGKQINKMGVHEMINFESRKTGKVRSRKWLHPKGEGWTHATRDVIQRFETECDEIDVPAPTNDNNNGGNGAMSESGRVLRAIQTQMMRDSGGPTLATLAGACKLGPDATRAALGELMVDGKVEKCGDEYHTAAVADEGDVDE